MYTPETSEFYKINDALKLRLDGTLPESENLWDSKTGPLINKSSPDKKYQYNSISTSIFTLRINRQSTFFRRTLWGSYFSEI